MVMRETMGRELVVKSHHDVHLEMEIVSVIVFRRLITNILLNFHKCNNKNIHWILRYLSSLPSTVGSTTTSLQLGRPFVNLHVCFI